MKNAIVFESEIYHHQKLNMHYLELSKELLDQLDGQFQRGRFNKRVKIKIESIEWQAGIVALGAGAGYITLSKERMKKLDVHFGETIKAEITPDNSEFGMEMAIEFKTILDQDDEAKNRFYALKKSLQRYMLYYVIQVKSSDARLKRALMLIHNMKMTPVGQEDFRRFLGKE